MNKNARLRKLVLALVFILAVALALIPLINSYSISSLTYNPSTLTGNSVNITWSTNNATNYSLCYYTSVPFGSGLGVCTSVAATFQKNWNVRLSSLANDTRYYYKVITWNSTLPPARVWLGNTSEYNFSTPDIMPPSAPGNFRARFVFNGTRTPTTAKIINVSWIAPGDNGMKKNASTYYIGYKNTPYTGSDLSGSIRIIKIPKSSLTRKAMNGSLEYMYFAANNSWFPEGTYYFAMIAEDDGNKVLPQKWNSTLATNSTSVYVDKTAPMIPVLWYNYRYFVTNKSRISVYGYTNESWSNVTVYATRYNGTGVANTNTSVAQTYKTRFLNYSIIREQAAIGTKLLKINLTDTNDCPTYVSSSNYVALSNHNRSYLLFYKINNLVSDPYLCIFNLTQPLESNVPLNTVVRFYNNSRPKGWFNISVLLYSWKNRVTARAVDYYYNTGVAGQQIIADYDNKIVPNLSRSYIQDQINAGNLTIRFNVSEDGIVNISKTSIKVFRYSNRLINYTFRYPQNISCTPRNIYNSSFNCTVSFVTRIPDERYNLTFNTSDIYSNVNITKFYSYYKYRASPTLMSLKDGGVLHSLDDFGTWFRFNWTMLPPNPNIIYYNYSIGTASYPLPGWNSVVPWARFNGTSTNVNYTSLGNGTYTAMINFNNCTPACHPLYDNRYYLTLKVIASQNTSNYYSTDGIVFVDDVKPRNSGINLRDVFNETYLTSLTRIRFNYSAYDFSGIKNYELILSNVSYSPSDGISFMLPQNLVSHVTLAGTQTDFTITGLSLVQGKDYYIHVRAIDNPGLIGNFSIKKFTVDTTPVTNDSIKLSNTILPNYPVTLNAGYDNESGILWERLIVTSTAFTNNACGQIYTQYYATNISTFGQSVVMVNLQNGRCYNFRLESKNKAGLTKTTYVQGEFGSAFNRTIFIDTTPPTNPRNVKITSGNNGVITHDPFNLAFEFDVSSDPESGINRYEYYIEVKDAYGNASEFFGPISIPNQIGTKISTTVRLSDYGKFLVNDHEYRVKVRAYNNFNLSSSGFNNSDYIIYTDTTPPTITSVIVKDANKKVLAPIAVSPNTYNLSTSVANLTIILNENNSYCRFSPTRVLFQDMSSPLGTWSVNNTFTANWSFAQGDQDLYILCSDQQDNHMDIWDAYHILLKVDSVPPTINIVQPQNKTYGKKIQYQFNISDYSGISRVWTKIVNKTNPSQIYSPNTTLAIFGNVVTGVINFSSSFDDIVTNVTLFVYSNDTRGNIAVKTMNFTLNGRNPTIVFNNPEIIDKLFRSPFLMNISITNANYADVRLFYYDSSNVFKFNITRRNATNKNYTITRMINTANTSAYPEGRYLIRVIANNTYFGNSTNTIDINRTFIIDKSASRYNGFGQIKINNTGSYIMNDSVIIRNTISPDGLLVNLSVGWYEPNQMIVSSGLKEINFSIRKEIKGINSSWVNHSGTSDYYVLNKNSLTQGAKYYWKSSILDNAGNRNETPIMNFIVENMPIQKVGNLLDDTKSEYIVLDTDWISLDLSDYYYEQDYNQTITIYPKNLSGAGIFNYSIDGSTKIINITNLANQFGTQVMRLNISDGFSNITQYINLTFANRTILNVRNNGNTEIWAIYNVNAFGKKEFYYYNGSAGNNIIEDIPRGNLNITLTDISSTVVKVFNYTSPENINISLATSINISKLNLSILNAMNITLDNSKKLEPVLGLDLDLFNQNKLFELSFNRTITVKNSMIIFNRTSSGINYSEYEIVNLGVSDSIENNYTNMTVILLRDRSVAEICNNGFDDNYDGLIDNDCTVPPSSGGGSTSSSSSVSSSISFIPKTVVNSTVNSTGNVTKNETKYITTPIDKDTKKTSSSQGSQTTSSTSTSASQITSGNYKDTPYTESTGEFIQINVIPIITIFVFITLLGTISILLVKRKPEPTKPQMSIKERLDYVQSIVEQSKKTRIHTTIKVPEAEEDMKTDERILKYLDYALEHEFSLEDARKRLIEHGFDKKHIDKHISMIKEKAMSIRRIKDYLEKRWDDKKKLSSAAEELGKVGWNREYISKAMNELIEEKDESTKDSSTKA